MDCYWNDWYPSKEIWCEEKICGFITNPINTFSNISYLIVGNLIMEFDTKIGLATIFLGLMSSMYHLSDTMFFRFMDIFSINILYSIIITNSLYNKKFIEDKNNFTITLIFNSSCLIFTNVFIDNYIYYIYFIILTVIIFYIELSLNKIKELVYTSFTILSLGFIFSMLDKHSILCDKDSYFQGHSLWHVLSSISIYFIAMIQSL